VRNGRITQLLLFVRTVDGWIGGKPWRNKIRCNFSYTGTTSSKKLMWEDMYNKLCFRVSFSGKTKKWSAQCALNEKHSFTSANTASSRHAQIASFVGGLKVQIRA
jgi:hypothetical protein